ncbi:MAG: DNA-binding protein [Planctomycetes bacterium]|nr:DNA-binding protein [Planctomycetota bacterium]
MNRGRKPTISNLKKAVVDVCEAISAKGKRPSMLAVRNQLVKLYGAAPSLTKIAPLVRDWKTARRDSKAVDAVCRAFAALGPEEQKAVRERLAQ